MDQEVKYIDLDEALSRLRGNKALYVRMLGMFLQSKEFDTFDAALASKEYKKAGESAHAIKGMTGNLSMTALFRISSELMVLMATGDAPPEDLLQQYRQALAHTRKEVAALLETP